MTTFYADSAGASGSGSGVDASNPCSLADAISNNSFNDNSLHSGLNAGDVIYVKNGTTITYDSSVADLVSTAQSATATSPIRVIGYATTPGDGGVVVINDSNGGVSGSAAIVVGHPWWSFQNLKFTNVRRGINADTSGANGLQCRNIEVDTPYANGIEIAGGTGNNAVVEECYIHGSVTGSGFLIARRATLVVNCVAIGNGGDGFYVGNTAYGATLFNCIAHNNGSDGVEVIGPCLLVNCTMYGNAAYGLNWATDAHVGSCISCIFDGNTSGGIDGGAGTFIHLINCYNQSVSANVTAEEVDAIGSAPTYTDAANDDFSLTSASAGHEAGAQIGGVGFTAATQSIDIGALQRAEAASGGGGGGRQGLHGIEVGAV